MRVVHVIEVSSGGVVTYAQQLVASQLQDGHEVHVVAPAGVTFATGAQVHRWSATRRALWSWPSALRRLRHLTAELAPDVVHLHSFFPGLWGRVLRPGRPTVYQPHSWAFQAAPRRLAGVIAAWERWAARHHHLALVNCADEAREGRDRGVPGPIAVVGLPVDLTHFTPAPDLAAAATLPASVGPDSRLVVCIGRISRQKGQDQLVAAWEECAPDRSVLALVGAASDVEAAQLAAAAPQTWGRSIVAVGAVDDVRPWLRGCDVVVMPSRYEGQSVAMAEALACGAPVVATRVNGASEAILEGPEPPAGAVVPEGDMSALLSATADVLSDPMLAPPVTASRHRAERLFNAAEVVRRITVAYDQARQQAGSGVRT